MRYCCKYCKNVLRDKKFLQSRFFCLSLRLCNFPPEIQDFFKLGTRTFHFPKYNNFFQNRFFYFSSSDSSLLKYKKNMRLEIYISGNIRDFLILELESSISWNIRNFWRVDFFFFFSFLSLGLKVRQGALYTV